MIVYKSSKLSFHRQLNFGTNFYYITFKDFIYFFFRERGRRRKEGERGRETSIGCLLQTPYWGPGAQPRHVPWRGMGPRDPLVCGLVLNPLSHTRQVWELIFKWVDLQSFFFPPSGKCYSGNYHIFKTSLQNFLSLGFCRLHGPTDGTVVQVGLKGDLIPVHPGLHDRRQLVSSRCTLGLQAHRHLSWPQWKQGVHFLWVHLITKDG